MLLALVHPMIRGLERIETTQLLRQMAFKGLAGLPSYPEATVLRRFLLRVAPAVPQLRALHDRFLHRPPKRINSTASAWGETPAGDSRCDLLPWQRRTSPRRDAGHDAEAEADGE